MAEQCPQHHWTGANGEQYCAGTVEDRHLLFYFRLQQERFEERGGVLPAALRRLVLVEMDKVREEIERRGLTPLPLRDAIARQVAEERRQRAAQNIIVEDLRAPSTLPQGFQAAVDQERQRRQKPRDISQPKPPAVIPVASMPTGRKIVIRKKTN